MDAARPDGCAEVRPVPLATGCVIGCVSRGADVFDAKAVNPRGLPRSCVTRSKLNFRVAASWRELLVTE